MGRKRFKKLTALTLAVAMVFTMNGMSTLSSSAKTKAKKKVALNKTSLSLKVGQTKKLTVKNKPAKAKLKWSTSNKKVATVKNGKVKAVKKGSAKITCKVTYKNKGKKVTKKLTAKVKVTAKKAAATATPASSAAVSSAPAPSTVPSTAPSAVPSAAAPSQKPAAKPTATAEPMNEPAWKSTLAPAVPDEKTQELLKQSNVGEEHKSANGITTKDNGLMRKELSSQDLMSVMGLGWNLGNQMEQSNCMGNWKTVTECETSAGNPVATQQTFDGLKSYGVNTVRVPVAWSNFVSDDGTYTINEELFNRVEEVINYALNAEM